MSRAQYPLDRALLISALRVAKDEYEKDVLRQRMLVDELLNDPNTAAQARGFERVAQQFEQQVMGCAHMIELLEETGGPDGNAVVIEGWISRFMLDEQRRERREHTARSIDRLNHIGDVDPKHRALTSQDQ